MDTQTYRARLQALPSALEQKAEQVAIRTVQSGISIVKDYSIADGIFVDGIEGNTVDYSVNPILTVRFVGKELNSAGKAFIAENRVATWADFRAAQGLPTDNVNLSYSNRMWTSIAILSTVRTGGKITLIVGSADPTVLEYIGRLAEKYGNFIRPTQKVARELGIDAITELSDFVISFF